MSAPELALILPSRGEDINLFSLQLLLIKAGVQDVSPFLVTLFAKVFENKDVNETVLGIMEEGNTGFDEVAGTCTCGLCYGVKVRYVRADLRLW